MIKDHPGITFGLWIILIWVSLGAAAATDHSTFFEIAWIASLFYGLFLVGNYWFRARPRRKKALTAASPGRSEPIKEPEQLQSQFETTLAEQIEILAYLLYTRGCRLAKVRFPDEEADGIGAHIKLYCTGIGEPIAVMKSASRFQNSQIGKVIHDNRCVARSRAEREAMYRMRHSQSQAVRHF